MNMLSGSVVATKYEVLRRTGTVKNSRNKDRRWMSAILKLQGVRAVFKVGVYGFNPPEMLENFFFDCTNRPIYHQNSG